MKKSLFNGMGLMAIAISITLIIPTSAAGARFSYVSSAYYEDARFNPPNPPFTYIQDDPDISVEGLTAYIFTALGLDLGSVYGPGISTWDNYVGFDNDTIEAHTSAVGTVASFADVTKIGDTQYVKDTWHWAAIFELKGEPGEHPVDVHLDYKLDFTYFNLAVAGRSRATTDLLFGAYIIPANKTGLYSQNAANNYGYRGNFSKPPTDASFKDSFSFHGGDQYTYLGGFKEATRHIKESFDLGSMKVGDRIYIYGFLGAYTECMMYHPPTLDVATMFPSFIGDLVIEPVAPTMTLSTQGLSVDVSWTKVPGATGYTLYYAPYPLLGPGSVVGVDMGTATSFDAELWEDAAYYVAIKAYDAAGHTSEYSNVGVFTQLPYPTPPVLTATTNGTTLNVSWTPVAHAKGYTLYYAPYPYAGEETIGSIEMRTSTESTVTLPSGSSYFLAVEAYDGTKRSGYSNVVLFTIGSP